MGALKVVIVGAGAVGAVLGTQLTQAGHDVSFWVRRARRAQLAGLSVERDGERVSIAPRCLSAGDRVPDSDWVIVCVRGEQLDDALRELVAHMGSARRVAIASITLSGVVQQARACGLTGEVYALHVSFGSYASEPTSSAYRWFPFAPPSLVTPDGVRTQLGQARALARALTRAGIWTRASLSVTVPMRALSALVTVFTLGWSLCDWQLERFARQAGLRAHTATAMHEALRLVLPARSALHWVPRWVIACALRALPWFMGEHARVMWRSHGPKIRAQNAQVTRALLARAEREGRAAPVLASLFEEWREDANGA